MRYAGIMVSYPSVLSSKKYVKIPGWKEGFSPFYMDRQWTHLCKHTVDVSDATWNIASEIHEKNAWKCANYVSWNAYLIVAIEIEFGRNFSDFKSFVNIAKPMTTNTRTIGFKNANQNKNKTKYVPTRKPTFKKTKVYRNIITRKIYPYTVVQNITDIHVVLVLMVYTFFKIVN